MRIQIWIRTARIQIQGKGVDSDSDPREGEGVDLDWHLTDLQSKHAFKGVWPNSQKIFITAQV